MKYVGTKVVEAEPMTRGDYNIYRGWKLPDGENPEDQGYKITYCDGYVSWCPANQFDTTYVPVGDTVKIGSQVYEIKLCKELRNDDDILMAGKILYNKQKIKLYEKLNDVQLHIAMLHELLHGIAFDRDLKIGEDERQIDQLATGLYQVIVENPHLFYMGFHK